MPDDFLELVGNWAMSGSFVVKPLTADQIPQAFPVVAIFDHRLKEAAWSEYAAALVGMCDEGLCHGIMTVQNRDGYIHGLSAHHLKHELRGGRILEIENFVVVNLVGAKTATRILLESLEGIARTQHCRCISLKLLDPRLRRSLRRMSGPHRDIFEAAGFHGEPLRLRKCFEDGGPAPAR